ncbi:hypothetical protein ACIQNU_20975 [Streptomyces sp. NPDC091292]|uniref:hypothetical protein n=1 Tax=Streptomyces sp. NPDC091292 TaxID=3365991 RepID=UPI003813B271
MTTFQATYRTTTYRTVWWTGGALALCGALLTGCTSQPPPDKKADATPTRTTASPSPTSLGYTPDPARVPTSRTAARALAARIATGPEVYGPGYEKSAPYDSDPAEWTVLDGSCDWQRERLPADSDVLATLTRRSELPASGGKGRVRIAAVVTVHRDTAAADREMAETLEEAMRCPDQRLGPTERVTELLSLGSAYGQGGNMSTDDVLNERGKYVDETIGGAPVFYGWQQSRLGPVTFAVVVKGAQGFAAEELERTQVSGLTSMLGRIKQQLGATS